MFRVSIQVNLNRITWIISLQKSIEFQTKTKVISKLFMFVWLLFHKKYKTKQHQKKTFTSRRGNDEISFSSAPAIIIRQQKMKLSFKYKVIIEFRKKETKITPSQVNKKSINYYELCRNRYLR